MQDCAVRLHDDFLKWETERQNRMRQEAKQSIEEKNSQKRAHASQGSAPQQINHPTQRHMQANAESRPGADAGHTVISTGSKNASNPPDLPFNGIAATMEEAAYLVRHIPDMRSALMPPENNNEDGWSKPFSLAKADMEPWLSFFSGYKKSRLFIEPKLSNRPDAADGNSELQLDFAVRAMLELTQLNAAIILEPPVCINGETHYLDLDAELRSCRDPARAKSLIGMAGDIHANHLAQAVEKGREMGDRLHEAWMGEGYVNLIDAWIATLGRKPTVEELHLMFSTGRLKPAAKKSQPFAGAVEAPYRNPQTVTETIKQKTIQRAKLAEEATPEQPDAIVAISKPAEESTSVKTQRNQGVRRILIHLFHIAVCCAVVAAYVMLS